MAEEIEFYRETEFKDTKIGKLPEEWKTSNLGEVSYLIMGQSPPSKTYNRDMIGLPFLQGRMDFGDMYPNPSVYCSKPIKIAEEGDVLVSVRAPVGDVNIATSKLCIGRGLAAIRPDKNQLDAKFIFYQLKHFSARLVDLGSGSTFKAIRRNDLERFPTVLPPLSEQQKIASILSTVDESIQKTDDIIAKTERLKKGLMQELLTKGIGHKEFKDTEIGKIPKEWEVIKLGDMLLLLRNGLTLRQRKEGNGYPVTRIETISEEKIDPSKLGYVIGLSEKDIEEYRLIEGDILFSHINSLEHIGKTAIYEGVPGFLLHGMNLLLLRPDKNKVHPKFLLYLLRLFRTRKIFWIMAKKAVNQASINQTELGNLKIFLPPFEEQQKITEILSTVDKKLEILKQEKVKLERIKQWFMEELLTGSIRVRVA